MKETKKHQGGSGDGANRIQFYLIAAGAVGGVLAGFLAGEAALQVQIVGELFLRALKMIIVPLVMSSIIVGVSSLGDVRKIGKLGGVTVAYYAVTTLFAVVIGLILVNVIQPGSGQDVAGFVVPEKVAGKDFSLTDVLLGLVTPNIFKSMAETDVLPLIVFSLVLGGVLTTLGKKGRLVLDVVDGLNDAFMKIVHLLMWFAPFGIFALVASRLGGAMAEGAFLDELRRLAAYGLTVIAGLAVHAMIVLPAILYFLARRDPLRYARNLGEVLFTAFGTASSSATLPLTIEESRSRNKVSREATSFVLPLGATINMDGTALYEAVAAVFIAQAFGVELTLADQVIVILTATLASIGAAGIPEAGLVTMVLVLNAVGLPLEGLGVILTIDWLLDRFRTSVNVWGDSIGAAVIDRLVIRRNLTEAEV